MSEQAKFPTGFIHYGADLKVLVAVGGHPFDRESFAAMFDAMVGVAATFVDQPVAARMMNPTDMREFDALLLYDYPGFDLQAAVERQERQEFPPSAEIRRGFESMLDEGKGVVALHHALAGWPLWDDYATYLGGRFNMFDKPGLASSGFGEVTTYQARVVDSAHPVTRGLPATFTLRDEPHLLHPNEASFTPLIKSDFVFQRENFYSTEINLAKGGLSNEGWYPPHGSNVIAWAKHARKSPLVYIQPGHGSSTYDDPNYRKLVHNALRWVASEDGRTWAGAR